MTSSYPKVKEMKEIEVIEEELPCPGSKIRSKGEGRGQGYGKGKGPLGVPVKRKKKMKWDTWEEI